MLTRAAFLNLVLQDNPGVYLGAPKLGKTQSSLLNLVNAIPIGVAAPNLLQIYQEMGNLPPPKKIRYAASLEAFQRSMPHPVYVTAGPFTVHGIAAQGIGIPRTLAPDPANHQTNVVLALHQLHGWAAGQALITAICAQIGINGRRLAVHPWNLQQTNNCYVAGQSDDAKTDLALAVEFDHNAVGNAIQACLPGLGQPAGPAGYAWLSAQIDAAPIYRLQGLPSAIASSVTYGAGWISAPTIQNWANGTTQFPTPLAGAAAKDAEIVLGTALRGGATPGVGTHTGVRWSATSTTFTDTLGAVQARPGYIALGHELIHAYHNMRGEQTGHEIGTDSRVLYEYLCIGLGVWAGAAHTENGLRASAGLIARTCY